MLRVLYNGALGTFPENVGTAELRGSIHTWLTNSHIWVKTSKVTANGYEAEVGVIPDAVCFGRGCDRQ